MISSLFGGQWRQTARLTLLDFDVSVHSDVPGAIELIEELYAPVQRTGSAPDALIIGTAFHNSEPGYFTALGGGVIVRTPAPTVAFAHLVFEANQQAIERSPHLVRLHAAGVARDGLAVALPGAMGAGKSTLAAGLVAAGLGYITDEVVALEPATGAVRAYGKPISLGTAPPELEVPAWHAAHPGRALLGASGLIPAGVLGDVVTDSLPLGAVILPTYLPDAPTRIERVAPADGLAAVAAHTFHLDEPGTLATLSALLAGVPCYRLVGGSLRAAVDAVLITLEAEIGAVRR